MGPTCRSQASAPCQHPEQVWTRFDILKVKGSPTVCQNTCHPINFGKLMKKTLSNSLLNIFAKNLELPSTSSARVLLHARTPSRISPRAVSLSSREVRETSSCYPPSVFPAAIHSWNRSWRRPRGAQKPRLQVLRQDENQVFSISGSLGYLGPCPGRPRRRCHGASTPALALDDGG